VINPRHDADLTDVRPLALDAYVLRASPAR
jgi:hypothetical protein